LIIPDIGISIPRGIPVNEGDLFPGGIPIPVIGIIIDQGLVILDGGQVITVVIVAQAPEIIDRTDVDRITLE
jgi:hypothetical protein